MLSCGCQHDAKIFTPHAQPICLSQRLLQAPLPLTSKPFPFMPLVQPAMRFTPAYEWVHVPTSEHFPFDTKYLTSYVTHSSTCRDIPFSRSPGHPDEPIYSHVLVAHTPRQTSEHQAQVSPHRVHPTPSPHVAKCVTQVEGVGTSATRAGDMESRPLSQAVAFARPDISLPLSGRLSRSPA